MADVIIEIDRAMREEIEKLREALEEMVTAHSMKNVGVNASMRRLNAIKVARALLAKAE
jgi:hypothetical protein